ncbi:RNA-binding S4 domain-containing protein [Buchananella felis]|uniref:RNA-binding S4 domain-containing protein n=1 Tax=Buchananella felis TaxID=3231492 RepID=UPI003529D267
MPTPATPPALAEAAEARVDVWLFAVRACKSRSVATAAARAGHVRINGVTAKASQPVRRGDEVRLRVSGFDRVLTVQRVITRRVGAPLAATCYQDLTPPRPLHLAAPVFQRQRGAGRPTKRERRQLDALRAQSLGPATGLDLDLSGD